MIESYTLTCPVGELGAFGALEPGCASLTPGKVAPLQLAPIIRGGVRGREVIAARWGLLPSWVESPGGFRCPTCVELELAQQGVFYRSSFERRRCLVPADGFFAWHRGERGTEPVYVQAQSKGMFFIAGIFERWGLGEGQVLSFALLTWEVTPPRGDAPARWPAVVPEGEAARWLAPGLESPTDFKPTGKDYLIGLPDAFA